VSTEWSRASVTHASALKDVLSVLTLLKEEVVRSLLH
jgi:hypothetical protein